MKVQIARRARRKTQDAPPPHELCTSNNTNAHAVQSYYILRRTLESYFDGCWLQLSRYLSVTFFTEKKMISQNRESMNEMKIGVIHWTRCLDIEASYSDTRQLLNRNDMKVELISILQTTGSIDKIRSIMMSCTYQCLR